MPPKRAGNERTNLGAKYAAKRGKRK